MTATEAQKHVGYVVTFEACSYELHSPGKPVKKSKRTEQVILLAAARSTWAMVQQKRQDAPIVVKLEHLKS